MQFCLIHYVPHCRPPSKNLPPGRANTRVPLVCLAHSITKERHFESDSVAIKKQDRVDVIGSIIIKDLVAVYLLENIRQELACDAAMLIVSHPTINNFTFVSTLWTTWELFVCTMLELIFNVFLLNWFFFV
jgi:hypothetical protein